MKAIKASEFKAKCLKLMDEVAESGESITITKNGKPVSRLEAYQSWCGPLFGALKGSVKIQGDIISPLDNEWEVNE